MGKFTIEKWKCDRCGLVADKRPVVFYPHYEVVVIENYDTASSRAIAWREMCPDCDTEVGKLLPSLEKVKPYDPT